MRGHSQSLPRISKLEFKSAFKKLQPQTLDFEKQFRATIKYNPKVQNDSRADSPKDDANDSIAKHIEQIAKPEPIGVELSKIKRMSLIGTETVRQFYNTYKNNKQTKKNNLDRKTAEKWTEHSEIFQDKGKQAIEFLIDTLDKYDFPPQKMNLIREKGEEEILYFKNFGLGGANNRIKVIADVAEKYDYFRVGVFSSNSLFDLGFVLQLKALQELDLSYNHIGYDAVGTLITFLKDEDIYLRVLNLQSNMIGDAGGALLIDQVKEYGKLEILNISRNSISQRSAKSLKSLLLEKRNYITQLYLHWNQLDHQSGRLIFQGLAANKGLKVLDLSWNYIGGEIEDTRKIANSLGQISVLHLDMSFCGFSKLESSLISGELQKNHITYGFHFEGNFGYVNFRGSLIVEEKKQDQIYKNKFPIPINYSMKRINSILPNDATYTFRSEKSSRDVCWICQGWSQIYFYFQPQVHAIHLDFEGFHAVKTHRKTFRLIRMCPATTIKFAVSSPQKGLFVSSKYNIQDGHYLKVKLQDFQKDSSVKQLNTFNVPFKRNIINSDYDPTIKSLPRMPDIFHLLDDDGMSQNDWLKMNNNEGGKGKRKNRPHIPPPPMPTYRELKSFKLQTSAFQEWRPISEDVIQKCIKFDFAQSKLKSMYDSASNQNIRTVLKKHYELINTVYSFLACKNRIKNHFMGDAIKLKQVLISANITDKILNHELLTVIFGSVMTKIHQFELDIDHTAKNIRTGIQWLSRPQFVELLSRIANERYCKKSTNYVPLLQRRTSTNSTDSGSNFRQYLLIQQAIEKILTKLSAFAQKLSFHKYREKVVWSSEICLVVDFYSSFLKALYLKYRHSATKFTIKEPGMYFADWMRCFKGLIDHDNPDHTQHFLLCKYLEIEEGMSEAPPSLNYVQFLQSVVRVTDIIDPSLLDPKQPNSVFLTRREQHQQQELNKPYNGYPRKHVPISFKLEDLLIHLYKKNSSLSSLPLSKVIEKGGFLAHEKSQFSQLVKVKGLRHVGSEDPFDPGYNRVCLHDVLKYEKEKFDQQMRVYVLKLKELQQAK